MLLLEALKLLYSLVLFSLFSSSLFLIFMMLTWLLSAVGVLTFFKPKFVSVFSLTCCGLSSKDVLLGWT